MSGMWPQWILSGLSALIGGFVGGWLVAYRMGQWRQRVDDRLGAAESRLKKGDIPVGQVPIIGAKLEIILQEIKEIKTGFVRRDFCEERHAKTGPD